MVQLEQEEAEFNHARDLAEAYANITPPIARNDPLKASAEAFSGLDKESLCGTLVYETRYGKEPVDKFVWRILEDLESIDLGMPDMDGLNPFKKDIDLNKDTDLNDVVVKELFPCIEGHAKIVDDQRSLYFSTINYDNIIFHDVNAQDPD